MGHMLNSRLANGQLDVFEEKKDISIYMYIWIYMHNEDFVRILFWFRALQMKVKWLIDWKQLVYSYTLHRNVAVEMVLNLMTGFYLNVHVY